MAGQARGSWPRPSTGSRPGQIPTEPAALPVAQTGRVDSDGAGLPNISAWPGVVITGTLTGGARAGVYAARRGHQRLVVKVSPRVAASLDWELDLLLALSQAGVKAPVPVATQDGRWRAGPVFISSFLPGQPPATAAHWRAAAAAVAAAHEVTRGWPQRPGSANASRLMTTERGADVDLAAMPPDAVDLVRACWQPLLEKSAAVEGGRACVVHGDLGAGAFLVDGDEVGIIDWDEARVDVPVFDLADLASTAGDGVEVPAGITRQVLAGASLAWETATCWVPEPAYARECLRQLQQRTSLTKP